MKPKTFFSFPSEIFTALGSAISKVWNKIKSSTSAVWNSIKSTATTVWGGIKSAITTVASAIFSAVKTYFSNVKSNLTTVFNGIKSVATTVWGGIKSAITKPIESAKSTVLKIIDKIKNAFSNMKITIPKPKMPKVSVQMKKKGGIPYPDFDVSWFAKGGVFTGPSVVGLGEAGPEAIVPLKGKNMRPFAQAIASEMGGAVKGDTIINVYSNKANPVEIARARRQEQRRLALEWGV